MATASAHGRRGLIDSILRHAAGMRTRVGVAIALLVVGGIWILQGIDVLGGSGMSGHIEWTVIGAVVVVVAIGLLAGARKPSDE